MAVLIDASCMRHRVSFAKPAQTSDLSQPFGKAAAVNPQPYATVWAEVKALAGRDLVKAQQFISDVTHTVTIRYRTGINSGDIVIFKARKFRVLYQLNPEERNIRLDLLCSEINEGTVVSL